MKNFSRYLNVILMCAVIAAALLTLIGPAVIRVLFTPPVSFGTNCEPAASWSMSKLIWTQVIGFILGALAGFVFMVSRPKSSTDNLKVESKGD